MALEKQTRRWWRQPPRHCWLRLTVLRLSPLHCPTNLTPQGVRTTDVFVLEERIYLKSTRRCDGSMHGFYYPTHWSLWLMLVETIVKWNVYVWETESNTHHWCQITQNVSHWKHSRYREYFVFSYVEECFLGPGCIQQKLDPYRRWIGAYMSWPFIHRLLWACDKMLSALDILWVTIQPQRSFVAAYVYKKT